MQCVSARHTPDINVFTVIDLDFKVVIDEHQQASSTAMSNISMGKCSSSEFANPASYTQPEPQRALLGSLNGNSLNAL